MPVMVMVVTLRPLLVEASLLLPLRRQAVRERLRVYHLGLLAAAVHRDGAAVAAAAAAEAAVLLQTVLAGEEGAGALRGAAELPVKVRRGAGTVGSLGSTIFWP